MNPFETILTHLRSQALEAGEIMRHFYKNPDCKVYLKPDGSKVTDADLTVSKMVQLRSAEAFPGILLYSEEANPKPALESGNNYFIIDELDGTSLFVDGMNGWSHLAAYYDANEGLTIGVIYYPLDDVLLYSLKGEGAFLEKNGETTRLETPPVKDWQELCFSHPLRYRGERYMKVYKQLGVGEDRIYYTTGLRTLDMALGKLDVITLLQPYISPWDLSAEKAFLEELGFNHSYLDGSPIPLTDKPNKSNPGYLMCPPVYTKKLSSKILTNLS